MPGQTPLHQRVWTHRESQANQDDDASLPETWVSIHDFLIDRVIKRKEPEPEEHFLIRLRKPVAPPPPESKLTTFDTLRDVYQVLDSSNAVFQRVTQVQAEFQQEMQQGAITREELGKIRLNLRQARENHARQVEGIIDWYLEHFYRIYYPPKKRPF